MPITTEIISHIIITIGTPDTVDINRNPPHKSDSNNTTIGSHIADQSKYLLFNCEKQSLIRWPVIKAKREDNIKRNKPPIPCEPNSSKKSIT